MSWFDRRYRRAGGDGDDRDAPARASLYEQVYAARAAAPARDGRGLDTDRRDRFDHRPRRRSNYFMVVNSHRTHWYGDRPHSSAMDYGDGGGPFWPSVRPG